MDLRTIREHLGYSLFMVAGAALGMSVVHFLSGIA